MATHLPQNKFYSAADIPSSADEAGASSSAPTPDASADISVEPGCSSVVTETEAAVSVRTAAASDLQALGALSGTDLINEIFAVKPKHFKLKHKRRLKLPRFAPDYEAMEAAMYNPGAPRALEGDPVWADPAPIFLRDA